MNDLGRYFAFWPMPRARANRCIDAGDVARNAGAWEQAAFHYRRAVTIQPRRRPIWVQLGHAEKEAGRPQAALEAYARASLLPGDDGEAALHHGLQAKALGFYALAKSSFEKAFRENPASPGARGEWQVMLHHPLAASEEDKASAAELFRAEKMRLERVAGRGTGQTPLIFDITDLLHHFRNARLPTGVQRVQMEVICAAIPFHPDLRICCYTGADQGWVLLPVEQFVAMCELALADSDMFAAEWIRAIEMLAASVALATSVGFVRDDVLINLGTSWVLPNYFLNLRYAKRMYGIRYMPFVHDVIPVMASQYCLDSVVESYLGWIGRVFNHADHFLTNSHSTSADLRHVADLLGQEVDESNVTVVTLDADMTRVGASVLPASSLDQWGLTPGSFVLFVSSIEPRKNHLMAFRAWQAMLARNPDDTPDLVCVGHGGWLNGPIHALLREDSALSRKTQILSKIRDDELTLLYRHCRFTIYPSHYEGWGMPVTESLCHGKVPIVTRCSSLTEAGRDFAVYVEPGDALGLAWAVEKLCQQPDHLAELEARIARNFRPRSWTDVAAQIIDVSRFHGEAALPETPCLHLDTLYRLREHHGLHLVPGEQVGEMLRYGLGWQPLEGGLGRAGPDGGILAFRVGGDDRQIACHLRLHPPIGDGVVIDTATGAQQMDRTGWLSFEAPVIDGQVDLRLSAGAGLSHLLISDNVDMATVVTRIAEHAASHYAFLRDTYPLVIGEEADPAKLAEFLPSLETGGLTREGVLRLWNPSARSVS